MKWERMTLRDRIAARIYVAMVYQSTEPIIYVVDAWQTAGKISRKKCRSLADRILIETEVKP